MLQRNYRPLFLLHFPRGTRHPHRENVREAIQDRLDLGGETKVWYDFIKQQPYCAFYHTRPLILRKQAFSFAHPRKREVVWRLKSFSPLRYHGETEMRSRAGSPLHDHRLRISTPYKQREIRVDGERRGGETPLVLMVLVQIAVWGSNNPPLPHYKRKTYVTSRQRGVVGR